MPEPASEQSLFLRALELPTPEDRAAYLNTACRDNPALRAELDALLAAHDRLGGALPRTTGQEPAGPGPAAGGEEEGAVLSGRYKLVELLGEGGMGAVWMAQQTEPVRRLVAVKVVKAGMDSKQVLARFEAERQALALMEHPNIARVLDAGTTAAGRPYFVMELVKGLPITRYCDERRLTPRQRLELFVPVCLAVQHAHQKGIIHRDLKPSNVLVAPYDGKPVPKVIDFGIAKAAGQQLTEKTLVTGFGAVVGTLEYMSPEQAELNQLDIDTRSDIYSLGVLLYELLTGTTPLEKERLKEAALLEVLRLIREEEPPRPSTRLSESKDALPSISAQRQMEPAKLTKLVRGELDWIVMKALEKDRNRRYETANGFALDIQRLLADEPVQACPPSAWYRFRKFSRRNKTSLSAAGLVLVALLLGSGISTWQAIRATNAVTAERQTRQNLDSAREEREKQQTQINRDLADALLEATRLKEKASTAAAADSGPWNQLRETVRAAQTLAGNELADPVLCRRLQDLVAQLKIDENDRRMVARLEAIRLQYLDAEDLPRVVGSKRPVYEAAFREYGLPIFDLPVEEAARRLGASAIHYWLVWAMDDCAENHGPLIRQLLPIAERAETDPWRKDYFANRLGHPRRSFLDLARQPEALDQPPLMICSLVRWIRGEDAIELLRAAQLRYPGDLWINRELGRRLLGLGRWDPIPERRFTRTAEAVSCCRAALAARPSSPVLWKELFWALVANEELQGAVGLAREETRVRPEDSAAYNRLGTALSLLEDYDGALKAHGEGLRLDRNSADAYVGLGRAMVGKGNLNEAIAAYRKAIALKPPDTLLILRPLAMALQVRGGRGDLDEAIALYRSHIQRSRSSNHVPDLYEALWENGNYREAIAGFEQLPKGFPRRGIRLAWFLATCPEVKLRDPARAIALARQAVDAEPNDAMAWVVLGVAQYRAGLYKDAVAQLSKAQHRYAPAYAVTGLFLAMAHHKLGNREQALQAYSPAIDVLQGELTPQVAAETGRRISFAWDTVVLVGSLPWTNEEARRIRSEVHELLKDYPEVARTAALLDKEAIPDTGGRRAIRVTAATLQADPTHYVGPAPARIAFRGKITADGPGTVSYTFLRSDGAAGPVHTLTFDKAGVKEVSTAWFRSGKFNVDGWQAIKVLSPNYVVSEKARFKVEFAK
jgi:serine/threonine protein kinase/tetratricopeptide (TPR) repeat protein